MKKFRNFTLLIALVLVTIIPQKAAAQENNQDSPEYVVQPGDTLSKIAQRFQLEVSELTSANSITNPNQVFAGDVLVLPGVEWVAGRLDVNRVPVGETFRSLRRRYALEDRMLARVGGLVTPSQVYAGYPLMIPTGIGEDFNAARAAISSTESLLGLAVRTSTNPWSLAAANQLESLWTGMRGDVLLIPGTNQPGPGALPSPLSVEISKGNFVQGKTTVIEVSAGEQRVDLTGLLIDKQLNFFEIDNGYVALQGVHVMTPPGPYMFTLGGTLEDGSEFEFSQLVRVESGNYESERITVDDQYLDEIIDNAEMDFITGITAPATPEKMWSGYFEKPTPFEIYINSFFGTRRSYNGSDYDYYHSGIDFGGGTGAEVLCPAMGKVVFTGQLDVRGKATILDHGWGIYTGYWHQSEIFVQEGDNVTPGQVIGLVGNTGRSSGAHLHWEVWAGGVQVEPFDWLVELFP
jgi:murein DD-endopeptidase MepM/ murein hydrolase activator NlpD